MAFAPNGSLKLLGQVVSISGAQAAIDLAQTGSGEGAGEARVAVGKFLSIDTPRAAVIAVITHVDADPKGPVDGTIRVRARVDLLGEIKDAGRGPRFQRGITEYPVVGDKVSLLGSEGLRIVYDTGAVDTISIGQLQQDSSMSAGIKVDDMLGKHFALFGSTGVGKSSGVAVLIREILRARPDLRIFLIDPHNEYGRSFRDRAQVLNPKNLKLPFWLFNFEETVDVFFRGRPGLEDEVEILAQTIPQAKNLFASGRAGEGVSLRKADSNVMGFTVDTPVPYRLSDLVSLIDERMGKLENRSSVGRYGRLVARIETVRKDPRYAFMFDNANVGGDTMGEVLGQLFRLPAEGKPMTVMQLAGFPAEVVDSVVSVLGRMAFDFGLWSDGAVPLLFVCEEAHRYAPGDKSIGFGPTRKAISRIAKEGRKYGVFLSVITQRPAELDATIISQCNTIFAMRMANERDQNIIRSAVSDAAAGLLAFVPSLGTREVFAFGEGVALPTRLRFSELRADLIPRSESASTVRIDPSRGVDAAMIERVVNRWRSATMGNKTKLGEALEEAERQAAAGLGDPMSPLEAERAHLRAAAASMAGGGQGASSLPKDGRGLRSGLLRK
ncbi:MAG: ATP-binding protein [Hyphomicrobiaceae bacterium]